MLNTSANSPARHGHPPMAPAEKAPAQQDRTAHSDMALLTLLRQLRAMHARGTLSDADFGIAVARLLDS